MPEPSIEEIAKNKERLREEIRQKEELFEAYALVEKDLQQQCNGQITLPLASSITATSRSRVTEEPGYGYKTRVVRKAIEAIEAIRKSFTIKDIQTYLARNGIDFSIESVTTVVNRLRVEDRPILRVKHPGRGRRPTIFEKT